MRVDNSSCALEQVGDPNPKMHKEHYYGNCSKVAVIDEIEQNASLFTCEGQRSFFLTNIVRDYQPVG